MKTVILTNVGTPQSPEPDDVGIYLREFLMDEDILPIPRPFRDILVKGLIVPKRKFSSAEKYQRIWTEKGSPLLAESQSLQEKLQKNLGEGWQVLLGMQVGKPSLKELLRGGPAQSDSEIYFCPLYPQYATATTGGAVKALRKNLPKDLSVKVLAPFYAEEWFLKAQAHRIRESLKPHEHLLLSYHGLPVSQLKDHRSDCYGHSECCAGEMSCHQNCYKAQCLRTSHLLQAELGLSEVSIGFQSRLGRAKWIEPSTEQVMHDLVQKKGVKHLKVACPSFVADCLETLEEIGLDLREKFHRAGGDSFEQIPCVNSHDVFVEGLSKSLLAGDPKLFL